uniref:uncharacterized protein LOC122608407 n=1 Tax=Erigeron canadensis TaxID=72917 RepID=UPI001CB89F35|nr:uncharacterized protein LOC122608407 [Erigeron canadensis]
MQQRNSGNRRPSGTDGSDFSYRMVVDNRYTKVAKGKSTLSKILIIQTIVILLGLLVTLSTLLNNEPFDTLTVAFSFVTFVSVVIGELGRKRSRASLLKFYIAASSIGVLGSILAVVQSGIQLKNFHDPVVLKTEKVAVLKIACISIGLFVQIFSIATTTSVIRNMSPPKRAS